MPGPLPGRLHFGALLLSASTACFSEPSYLGRLCNESNPCPEDLICHERQCVSEVPSDAGELESDDASFPVRDSGPRPDASPRDAEPADASIADVPANPDAEPLDTGPSFCMQGETTACYSGPPGTEGVGPCREGTATCVGGMEFGPCEDQVLPGDEICNGIDDDCDRVVDDGCPSGAINFVQPFDTALTGWLPFGDEWQSQGCAPDQVVVGFFGHYADYLNEVGEHCDTPQIVEDTTSVPYRYSLVLNPASSAVPRGGAMGTEFNGVCPAGTMVVGISGRSGSWIDQLSFTCAEFELIETTMPNGTPRFEVQEVAGSRTLVSLEAGGAGGGPFDLPCPLDQAAAVRLRGATGSTTCCPVLITTLGLGCWNLGVSVR